MRQTGLLIAFVCMASFIAMGQDDSGVQSRIVALEKAWNQAYKAADRKALDALLDDQIVLVNDDGSMQNKAEFLAASTKSNSQEQQVTPESITSTFTETPRPRPGFPSQGHRGRKALCAP